MIFVFDDVKITNVYKLKQVVFDPIKFRSFADMKETAKKVIYFGKSINDIDFGDQNFIESNNKYFISDLINENMKVYLLSYKLDKTKVYDFDNDKIFIYVKSSEKRNNLKEKSLEHFRMIYGETASIDEVDIVIGQKQYVYKNITNLSVWFDSKIRVLCTKDRIMNFDRVPNKFESNYDYDDNYFLSFVKKTNDENYYSNYISGILNSNNSLFNRFFSYLIQKLYGIENYNPSNAKCLLQTQSMTKDMKIINKIIRYRMKHTQTETLTGCKKEIKKLKTEFQYSDSKINRYILSNFSKDQLIKLLFIDGQIDLYLFDDNYRIVIENKILSGLNGKHDEISKEINQLITYNKYLVHLNEFESKSNMVIILCPYYLANIFVKYKIEENNVPILTYKDLSDFFSTNISLIPESYRLDFLKTINRQVLTKEELITYRFIKTLNS